MGAVVALGEASLVRGFALGGAVVIVAETPEELREAWSSLPDDSALVVLTKDAASALGDKLDAPGTPLTTVMP